jgi:two-component system CheB/CheR fusion protein
MSDTENQNPSFEDLLVYLQQCRGFDFTGYKRSTLMRRVNKRMGVCGIDNFSEYLDFLQVHPEEFLPLFNTILINVTGFLRDDEAWSFLREETLLRLINLKSSDSSVRIWSAGCASGEEPYTIAMILADLIGPEQFRRQVKIYATDVDDDALTQARQANYATDQVMHLPEYWRDNYFDRVGDRYIVRPDLRRGVIFGRHDLVHDAPISRLDLLICRNTLMYFNTETQRGILNHFHFALREEGIIFLGKGEMLLTHNDLFVPINLTHRIFRRVPRNYRRGDLFMLPKRFESEADHSNNPYLSLQHIGFDVSAEAQIILNAEGIITLMNEKARQLFNLEDLDLGRPLQDLEISYRPYELRSLIDQAYQEQRTIDVLNINYYHQSTYKTHYLDISVRPLTNDMNACIGVSITFRDVTHYSDLRAELQKTNQNLETANEELQSSNEELETTNEELQSTNEELETTNEELQSTNEELETINEELKSTNEELQTINEEFRHRSDELNQANSFLNSILASLKAGVVVLDNQLNITSWNHESEELWGLRAGEVKGQSLFVLDIGLPVEELRSSVCACLKGQRYDAETTVTAINRRGRRIQCRISVNPLLGMGQERYGVILLMEAVET